MQLLCDAIAAGAFSGPKWMVWRTLLADRPHLLNATFFLYQCGQAAPDAKPHLKSTEAALVLADLIDTFLDDRQPSDRDMAQPTAIPAAEPQQVVHYIDLDQAAALVNRAKRTLENQITKGKFPPPAIQGSGGKKSEWLNSELKPWLENEYGRKLPAVPPHYIR